MYIVRFIYINSKPCSNGNGSSFYKLYLFRNHSKLNSGRCNHIQLVASRWIFFRSSGKPYGQYCLHGNRNIFRLQQYANRKPECNSYTNRSYLCLIKCDLCRSNGELNGERCSDLYMDAGKFYISNNHSHANRIHYLHGIWNHGRLYKYQNTERNSEQRTDSHCYNQPCIGCALYSRRYGNLNGGGYFYIICME